MKRIALIVLFFIVCNLTVVGQQVTIKDRIKAEHIINFGAYINWKDKTFQKNSDKFTIGVYGSDSLMYSLLKKICKFRILKWKKIEIIHFNSLNEIKFVPILYVSYQNNNEVPKIDSIINNWSTLLITDSCNDYRGIMINFFPRNSLKRVEINKENITARGMKVNSLLYVVAKNYEEDWEKLYQKSETDLALEKETVEQQALVLKEQEKKIKQKEDHILKLSSNISQKEVELDLKQKKLNNLQKEIFEKNKLVTITSTTLKRQEIELLRQQIDIKNTQKLLKEQIAEYEVQKAKIDLQKDEISSQQNLIDSQKSSLNKSIADLKKQQLVLYFVLIALLLFGLMSIAIFRSYRIKKKANKILNLKNIEISRQNSEIIQQKEEIETQRDEIEAQRDFLARQRDQILTQNKDITDSITYASKIQHALLPPELLTTQLFLDHFVFYLPRDIVSGDFYWTRKKGDIIYVAVADCTGHGVPGAFMSMLGVAFLNEILDRYNCLSAGALLDNLREKVVYSLHQTENEGGSKDGMDISLITFNQVTKIAEIAGANNPIYHVRNNELFDYKPDKMPIGIYYGDEKPFKIHSVKVEKGDFFYLFSDGYADQFGGEKGKKFKYNALKHLCVQISRLSCTEQEKVIKDSFHSWKKSYNQVDDILFLGICFE